MRTELSRRLSELEQQAKPEAGMTLHDMGNGSLEMRWNGLLLNRIRKDDTLLDDVDLDIIPPEEQPTESYTA